MITTTPPIGILIDLPFGLLMWASFLHFLLIIVMNEDTGFSPLRPLRRLNAPVYAAISLIKPRPAIDHEPGKPMPLSPLL